MERQRWQKIESILDRALLLDSPKKKAAFITEACKNDEQLYKQVTILMKSIQKARKENFLENI